MCSPTMISAMGRRRNTSFFEPGSDQRQIIDARDVEEVRVTAEGLRSISIATPYGPGSRRALVATSDVMFGMARMFEMLREEDGDVFRVFRSMKEAMDWLDLDSGSDSEPIERIFGGKHNAGSAQPSSRSAARSIHQRFATQRSSTPSGADVSNTFFFQPFLPIPTGERWMLTARPVGQIPRN